MTRGDSPLEDASLGRRVRTGLLLGAAATLLAVGLSRTGPGRALERAILDRHLVRASTAGAEDIVLVQIGDADVESLRAAHGISWPWPLDVNVYLVDAVRKAGAAALVVDILHLDRGAGPEDVRAGSFDGIAPGERETLVKSLEIAQMEADPYRDALAALGPRCVVAMELAQADNGYEAPARREAVVAKLPDLAGPVAPDAYARPFARLPVLRVGEGAGAFGFPNIDADEDGVLRRLHALALWRERVVPSLALAAVAAADGATLRRAPDGVLSGSRHVRLAHDGAYHVPIARPGGTSPFPTVSARQLIDWAQAAASGEAPAEAREALAGRIVILGVNMAGIKDIVPTAAGTIEGPELHAHAIKALRTGTQRIRVPFGVDVAFTAGLALLLGLLLAGHASLLRGLVATGILVAVSQALPWWGHENGHVIAAAMPAVAVLLTAVGHGAVTLVKRTRANRWLKGTFGRYLAPSVIQALGRDPSLIKLGGRRRRLTLLFSDLAGFTTMARRMEPDQVVDLLNRYLSMHAGAVLAEGGVVDKFIGDAVMAFWGDPLEQSDQAARACRTALAVVRGMPDIEAYATRYGLEGFHARIGIHTGPAVVGNMGSNDRQDYTCIGDTVNLASRLEGANKAFGTTCLLGDATYQEAREAIVARHLADVVVVGQEKPLPVYELVGEPGDAAAEDRVARFDEATRLVREDRRDEARATLAALRERHPDDAAAAWLVRLLDELDAGRRPTPWDGTLVLDAK
ncbi:MAG: CHASE2 domain-containing protein [Planctomycetota bacterium]